MKKAVSKVILLLAFIVTLILSVFTGCFLESTDNETNNNKTNKSTYYKTEGEYKVGTDIEEGEYLLIADKQNDEALSFSYHQVAKTSDTAGETEKFLYNGNFYYRHYVSIEEGQYLQFSNCKLYKTTDHPAVDKNAASWHSGQYKVGVDLDAGEYKLTALKTGSILDYGYVQITRTPDSEIGTSDFIGNDNFESTKYITLEDGTYIYFNAATLTKIDD